METFDLGVQIIGDGIDSDTMAKFVAPPRVLPAQSVP